MAGKKGILVNSMIKDPKAEKWQYSLDGKPVSEFKFMKSLIREMKGETVKKTFYWTDKKVIAAMELSGVRVTHKLFKEIKNHILRVGVV